MPGIDTVDAIMAAAEHGRKYEQGVTQSAIFRFIIRHGGYATEPRIREFLRNHLDIRFERGIKTHLKNMENANLIKKIPNFVIKSTPESSEVYVPDNSNKWCVAYEESECYQYLCDLILRSHTNLDIADDIREFFTKTNASEDSITSRMVANNTQCFERYFTEVLRKEFYEVEDSPWAPDEELKNLVCSLAGKSPSLFAVGAQHTNRHFLATIRCLMGEEYYSQRDQKYCKKVFFYLISASMVLDYHVYRAFMEAVSYLFDAESERFTGVFEGV